MAKLIKGGQETTARPVTERVALSMEEDPELRVDRARERKAQLMRRAEEENARLIDSETALGLEQGIRAGRQEAGQLIAAAERRARLEDLLEDELLNAALKGARNVIDRALVDHPQTVVDIVRNALNSCRQQREVYLRVNPDDLEVLREHRRSLVDVLGRAKDVVIREDPEVARGGCIIQTESATVDATIDSQLEAIETVLRSELMRAHTSDAASDASEASPAYDDRPLAEDLYEAAAIPEDTEDF